jgi:hypothetical protein
MPPAMPALRRQLQSLGMRPPAFACDRPAAAPGDQSQSNRLAGGLPYEIEPFDKIAPEEVRVFTHWKVT